MIELVVISVCLLIGIAIILGLTIGITAKVFEVKQDPRVEQVLDALPGANCGGCGLAGCSDFAKAVVSGVTIPEKCPVCSEEGVKAIVEIMGLKQSDNIVKKVAVILCGGDSDNALFEAQYNGINDCKSASLIGGGLKGCRNGCLGLGTCARICPFDAIEITDKALAIVHPDLCVGCGKCVETCPKNLIIMVPETADIHVYCNSKEKALDKKKVCKVSCIGCRKCVKAAEEGQMEMDGFLARINYSNAPSSDLIDKAGCPTKCLRK
ncbi:MAG TPA: RnfABCDGE type electron transport complex subunit B [Victivallales bacterium]|nr:RnfABCDGE type electron transport complex subunit B [Victivallales bacterium]